MSVTERLAGEIDVLAATFGVRVDQYFAYGAPAPTCAVIMGINPMPEVEDLEHVSSYRFFAITGDGTEEILLDEPRISEILNANDRFLNLIRSCIRSVSPF